MTITTVPLKCLRLAKTNVRRSNGTTGIEMLAANILAHGLINPLQVIQAKKKGFYDVFAGGRRLRALTLLTENGSIDDDYAVSVEIKEASDTLMRDISLSENAMRVAMTAADECLAFDQMLGKDKSPEKIAQLATNYGTTVRHIEARLRLANLADPIFAALSDGTITLDAAKIYGLTADKDRQLAAYESLAAIRGQNDDWRIRKLIFDDALQASNPIALFIGEEAYREAGGRIEADLFKDAGSANWTDGHIARSLAESQLNEMAEQVRTENGLGWIKIVVGDNVPYDAYQQLHYYYPPRVKLDDDQQARLEAVEDRIGEINELFEYGEFETTSEEELQKELDALETEYSELHDQGTAIPDEDREHIGAFLMLTKEGGTTLYHQLFSTRTMRNDSNRTDQRSDDAPQPIHSRSLTEDMAMIRRDILAVHLANDPGLALDLSIFQLAAGVLSAAYGTGITLRIESVGDPQGSTSTKSNAATEALAQIRESLDVSWFDHSDTNGNFQRFRELSDDVKAAWLAYSMARSLKATSATKNNFHNPFHTMLGAIMEIDTATHWRPTADNYFGKLKKSAILERIGELGDPSLVARYSSSKKGEIADAAEKIYSGNAIIDPEIKAKALAWVPEELRFKTEDVEEVAAPNGIDPEAIDDVAIDGPTETDDNDAEAANDELVEA
ncbi:ParB/RepB/Spo0J family partition protein [uncultured Sphingorhabdus sp.]|mgnify:CR=1 FL=1|uniref:ParB/RepB/Spo0J family partition protein n=1 Tax=uncultured Sphingorhabdus sp. TaxID=1686106 RepID=UPI0026157F78|nr:ParB/RepB/Spo0J family partition protein [uncultured Sphingorhabdus sp.]HMS21770.1 ParB/RepB/Spo0J family partition protein [Sphingorhabdus sp.]